MKQRNEKLEHNLMALAENAKVLNNLDSIGPAGQQVFMHKLFILTDADTKRRRIEELTK